MTKISNSKWSNADKFLFETLRFMILKLFEIWNFEFIIYLILNHSTHKERRGKCPKRILFLSKFLLPT